MKKIIVSFIFVVLVFTPVLNRSVFASSGNLVNPGFETGNLDGWIRGEVKDYAGVVSADVYTTPYDGTYMAVLGRPGYQLQPVGPNIIYQDFTVVESTLAFAYNIFTYDYAPYNRFSYLLQDLTTGATIYSYSQTAWGGNWGLKTTGWRLVDLNLSSCLGRRVRLQFNVTGTVDYYNPTWVYIDSELPSLPTDTVPPTTTATLTGTEGLNYWYLSDVVVSLMVSDNEGGSGVSQTKYSFDNTNWYTYSAPLTVNLEGIITIYYYSTDNAENSESIKQITVQIDKTPPEVTINSPVNGSIYTLNQTILADWLVRDEISGIASVTATAPNGAIIDTASLGTKIFEVRAVDEAGHEQIQTVSYSVHYLYKGILQPINPDGSSIFKLGSTVPVKFRLTDFSGQYISTAIARLYLSKISDNVSGTSLEAVSTSAATSGNLFRYDSSSNQYIFNLNTRSLSVGTWQLEIKLDDGDSEYVVISLR